MVPPAGALSSVRVVKLADEPAESCGLVLAGLGADVVKGEPPGGPIDRGAPCYGADGEYVYGKPLGMSSREIAA